MDISFVEYDLTDLEDVLNLIEFYLSKRRIMGIQILTYSKQKAFRPRYEEETPDLVGIIYILFYTAQILIHKTIVLN